MGALNPKKPLTLGQSESMVYAMLGGGELLLMRNPTSFISDTRPTLTPQIKG